MPSARCYMSHHHGNHTAQNKRGQSRELGAWAELSTSVIVGASVRVNWSECPRGDPGRQGLPLTLGPYPGGQVPTGFPQTVTT